LDNSARARAIIGCVGQTKQCHACVLWGAQDVFWLNLVAGLLGASHLIEEVIGHCRWNVDDYGPEVANHLFIGKSKEAFDRFVDASAWSEFVARQTLETLVSCLELTVRSISSDVTAITSNKWVQCSSLGARILPGAMIGTIDRAVVLTQEGPRFEFTMKGRVYMDGETDNNRWRVKAEPDLELKCQNTN